MITEKRFASSHHGFWRELLPMSEHYIRSTNLALGRAFIPFSGTSPTSLHGVVNELGFRLFARARREGIDLRALDEDTIVQEQTAAIQFISNFRQHGRGPLRPPGATDIQDAIVLATRTENFFREATEGPVTVSPTFPGCGWLSECNGDVLCNGVLYEIKSGERTFRALDVKQVLVYCALNYAAKHFEIDEICLFNPREGVHFSESLNTLCQAMAGQSAVEVLGEIVEYVSASNDAYSMG
jgi:hypothetical protein